MDPHIKPIETAYNGYRFRSRNEARWAVFLDALQIRYEYEKEGFELGGNLRYLPDFWLPDMKFWLEIKGPEVSDAEWEKPARLALTQEYSVFLISGSPWPGAHTMDLIDNNEPHPRVLWYTQQAIQHEDWWLIKALYNTSPHLYWGAVATLLAEAKAPPILQGKPLNKPYVTKRYTWTACPYCWVIRVEPVTLTACPTCNTPLDLDDSDLQAAFSAARSARFEYGESGARR